jgi:hypothetical protein
MKQFMTDAYLVIIFPKDHPHFIKYQNYAEYWADWFGQTRTRHPKGFVEFKGPKL